MVRYLWGRVSICTLLRSSILLAWVVEYSQRLSKRYLRLDCDALRLRLRAVHEGFGLHDYSDRQVGAYFVSRYEYQIPPQVT
ncbi:hypothetical protein [Nostoc sp. ChiQUE01b]|uniref:hypothetical protein n=1 Tax=Nostoc sp. ChiQUE01b TaxID=3075376 RepID=UPI002AD53853|nr:hypothetical protein [Nostoc sp. ChiQUE01b]MDZ8257427.1 hypothetical protein [Nostoc sp. ChiQUE01b]